jgi:hypothetical protein
MKSTFSILLSLLFVAPVLAQSQDPAESVFAQYQAREKAFDPAAADLYCDSALIRNVRTYPNGQKRTLELPADKYKALIRAAMPLARAKGDYNNYSDVQFSQEGESVRITASRYSISKQYSSPISLLVGKCSNGDLGILEELSQSQP